jgi:type I restriction enzyme S subunit
MFYKETNFKEEPLIGKIPKDWEVVRLKDIADYINGYPFSPEDWKTEGLPIIRIQNLNDPSAGFNYFEGNIDDRYIIENGDLLFSWSASIGAYIWNRGRAVLNQHIFKVVSNDKVDKMYLFHALFVAIEQLKSKVHGSTMKHFKKTELQTKIPLPSLSEQKKIAGILGVVDLAVAKTGEVIAKTERLKKGLMQELLTKGIGHKEHKYSKELSNQIPKEWQIGTLGDKDIATLIMGQSPPSSTYNDEGTGLPFLQGKAEFGEIYPSPIVYCSEPIKIAESNDILLSVRAPVGEANIAPFKCCIGRGLSAIRVKSEKLHYLFLFYYLKFSKRRFESLSMGSTFKAIRTEEIEKFKIPLPNLSEQQKITEILSTVDKKLELERHEKARLGVIKRGLMDLLLTGKIRVKVD